MMHTVQKGIVHCEQGIPETPRWFSDSRLSFQCNETSVTQVDYRHPLQTRGNSTIFLQRLWDGFRYFVEQNKVTYQPEYTHSKIWPFGIQSEWNFDGTYLKHQLLAVEESIVFQIVTPADLSSDLRFKFEFYKDFALVPGDSQDLRYSDQGARRDWRDWEFAADENRMYGAFEETWKEHIDELGELNINNHGVHHEDDHAPVPLHIGISADFPIECVQRPINAKYILISESFLQPSTTYSFVVTFASSREAVAKKSKFLSDNLSALVAKQFDRYQSVSDQSPILLSPYPDLNDFISLVPLYHESCKVTDHPGALKAKNTTYWVWGWDGMTSNYASLYWGDHAFIKDMLRFYDETADPDLGIAHCYRNDMALYSVSALPAQSMYIALLQQYFAATGDLQEVKDRYSFSKRIFETILKREVKGTGFCEGASLFPDFPAFMQETGEDISSLNNTIFYCAVRSMEYLSELMHDEETRVRARTAFRRMEHHFLPLFFDEEKKFIVSSIDAATLEKRDSYNSNAVKWENHYCSELMEPVHAKALEFFEQHIVCKAGLREIPVWSNAYDMDANQLHCWWPVTGEYYMRLINGQNRPDLIEKWIGWVGYWTNKLTCPEGISCYINTSEPDSDRWNTSPGTWHAYSMRGWYQAAIHGVVGVGIEAGGITFYPYDGEEMTLLGLHYRGKRLDIEMRGSGPFIKVIEVNGKPLYGTNQLPIDCLGDNSHVRISVYRVHKNPNLVLIRHAYGLDISDYRFENGVLRGTIHGSGTCRLKLTALQRPSVRVNGASIDVDFEDATGEATAELEMIEGQIQKMEICA